MNIHSKSIWKPALTVLMMGSILLSACSSIPALSPATATPTTTPTPTAVPLKTLVVCLGDEPTSLYLYGNASQSMWSVLESLYDGPFDTVNYQPQPVIMIFIVAVIVLALGLSAWALITVTRTKNTRAAELP